MMTKLEMSIAWRYLRSRRGSKLLSLISLIAIGGVAIGVSALIVIIGVMNGLQTDLREKILIGSPDIRLLRFGNDIVMPDWKALLVKVRQTPDIVAAGPFVDTQALVQAGRAKYFEGVRVEGLMPDSAGVPNVTSIRQRATAGDFTFSTTDGKRRGAVLGSRLAERLGVTPGVDTITLMTVNPSKMDPATGFPVPTTGRFEVTGVFETGMYEYDNSFVFVSLSEAQRLAQLDTAVTGLELKTATREIALEVSSRLQDSLPLLRIMNWQQQNNSLFHALKLEKLGMTVILLLIVLVAAFNIVGTLIMVVTDKTKEIGILRAMGMPARSIRRVFFAQGVVIGVVGTVAGLVLGLVASVLIGTRKLIPLDPAIYFIDHLPIATQPGDVSLIVVASLAVAALATIYPAVQAARLYPVEAIRHE